MTTKANSQLGCEVLRCFFVQFSVNNWSLFLTEGFAPFYLTEQNKDVCEQKLEERNKDVCEQFLYSFLRTAGACF